MKQVILEQKLEKERLLQEIYIPRAALPLAQNELSNSLIKVITGPRRAGKSVFAIQLLKNTDFGYLNFDDERLVQVNDYNVLLEGLIEVYGNTSHLFLDEIQNLPRWELFVNRLQRQGMNLILTGSNSKLLSQELATHLTGRHIPLTILPFSFLEYQQTLPQPINPTQIIADLENYLKTGGYPEVITKKLTPQSYLLTLFESILFKDIVKRYRVRHPTQLDNLAHYIITNHSNEFSSTRINNILGFKSVNTIEKYISYLEETYLCFRTRRFDHSLKVQIKSPSKVYAWDPGMIEAVKSKTSPDQGRLIENLVAIELARREKNFFYYKTKDNLEVDFAIKEQLSVTALIQVAFNLDSIKTKDREIKALVKASSELNCEKLIILTWIEEGVEEIKGKKIEFIPISKWLLNSDFF